MALALLEARTDVNAKDFDTVLASTASVQPHVCERLAMAPMLLM